MMLSEITEVVVDNADCVVLKVKDGHEMDLIALGCFDGTETMFRLTKGETVTCTVFYKNRKAFSWHWGQRGYTLVSPKTEKQGQLIQACIERDFMIRCKT
ncbi:hypothetical protein IJG04_00315 [Candidatus Saccharibacteria bacterium]|nr:hypothetical protein [Candidatus Saccharibacteria bacterium]